MTEIRDFLRMNTDECVTVRSLEDFVGEMCDDIEDVRSDLGDVDKNNIQEILDSLDRAIDELGRIIHSAGC